MESGDSWVQVDLKKCAKEQVSGPAVSIPGEGHLLVLRAQLLLGMPATLSEGLV